jgi:hypothetical protein
MARENSQTKFAIVAKDIEFIKYEVTEIKHKIEGNFVTKEEFEPIKKIVYGIISLILTAVVGGLISLVVLR